MSRLEVDQRPRDANRVPVNRYVATTMVVVPTLGTLLAGGLAWHRGVEAVALWLLAILYFTSVIGVEIGFHRYFSHRAFKCGPTLRFSLAAAGSIAGEGPVLYWAATHRQHHLHADTEQDPHAPIKPGLAGFWRAHVGWLFEPQFLNIGAVVPDLIRDRTTLLANRLYFPIFLLGLLLPALIGWAFAGPRGAVDGLLWGGLVRICVAHQMTWSINSLCHLFGSRPYATADQSRNLGALAFMTLGGSWHNNHHAFPRSAFNDLRWWQLDPSAWLIRLGAGLGVIWDIRQLRGKLLRETKLHDNAWQDEHS
jgi:stearoyl-CoA desaturase (Delta-9 desaturase)